MNRRERRASARKPQKASKEPGSASVAALCADALAHLQAGRLIDAHLRCQKALEIDPGHAESLYLMGCVALEAGQHDHAVQWLTRACASVSKADYLSALGVALLRSGRREDAVQAFDRAIQLKPGDAQIWKNLAGALFELQCTDEALLAYRKVLTFDPSDWDATCRIGYLHYQSAQLEDALACFESCDALRPNHGPILHVRSMCLFRLKRYEQAISEGTRAHQLDPTNADTCSNIGSALNALQRHDEAVPWFDRALVLRPALDEVLYNKAFALGKLDRAEDALATLNLCLERRSNDVAALQLRAACLHSLRRWDESLADGQRAHLLDPANAGICNHVGSALYNLGRDREAVPWFEKAVGLQPDYVDALYNLTRVQIRLHLLVEAKANLDRIRAISPSDPRATLATAHYDLLHGNFEAGWAGREARWKIQGLPIAYPEFSSKPMWLGDSDITGKTILIYSDEGMGDAIQLARYLPMIAARGARVILAVQSPLVPLLSGVEGVLQCVAINSDDEVPLFDAICPMLSLPLAFRTRLDTIPPGTSYLPAPPEERMRTWNGKLPARDRLRVGLVWAGNPMHFNDHNRSIPLSEFAHILDVDATFVSLQKEPRPEDKGILGQTSVVDLTADLTDFRETTALLACLDLVIAVDTSVAHLAGALGRPTWLLLPRTPDYRWLLDRDDSPWYPTLRLFRQGERRVWAEVLDRIRIELIARGASFVAS